MGISKVGHRFRARLYHKGTTYNLGTYGTHLEASRAINAKRKELKQDDELDQHIQQIWVQDENHHEPFELPQKPNIFRRLWRKIKR